MIDFCEEIKQMEDECLLKDIIAASEKRLLELAEKKSGNQLELIQNLLKVCNKTLSYISDVGSDDFDDWYNDCHNNVGFNRGETVSFKNCLDYLKEDLEDKSIDEEMYHKLLNVIEKNARKGYAKFIFDW